MIFHSTWAILVSASDMVVFDGDFFRSKHGGIFWGMGDL